MNNLKLVDDMKKNKIDLALMDCYRELFKNSTPSADFDLLVEQAPINEFGQKVIDFMSYEIEESKCDQIILDTIKKHKISKYDRKPFRTTILLGCSPKFKRNENN